MDNPAKTSPAFALYGEGRIFPDVLHCETIAARAPRHGWKIGRHRHPDLHQFFWFQDGGVTLQTAGGERPVVPPAIVSMPRQVDHGFAFAAGTTGLVITVPASVMADLPAAALARMIVTAPPEGAVALFEIIARCHAMRAGLRDTALRGLVVALACLLAGDAAADDDPVATLFARFEDAVRAHAADAWGVADYAAHLGTSATRLNRVVRAQADLSVMGAVLAYRLGEAARRLAYTRQSVSMIAYDLGFSDPAYFARVFRKGLGVSPRAYRKRLDQAPADFSPKNRNLQIF